MSETNYEDISNSYHPGYYVEGDPDDPWGSGTIAGTGDIVTRVTGDLAGRILTRVASASGEVTITEKHWDIGYCVTCSDEQIDFEVAVDGDVVYSTKYYSGGGRILGPQEVNNIGMFQNWLEGQEIDSEFGY